LKFLRPQHNENSNTLEIALQAPPHGGEMISPAWT
jgi:hypothetical protein